MENNYNFIFKSFSIIFIFSIIGAIIISIVTLVEEIELLFFIVILLIVLLFFEYLLGVIILFFMEAQLANYEQNKELIRQNKKIIQVINNK